MKSLTRALRIVLVIHAVANTGCAPNSARGKLGAENNLDRVRQLSLVEELQLGSVSDPTRGFTSIRGVDVDRDGQVYVFESSEMAIRVYSRGGDLVRTIGRRGEGPAEFRGDTYDNMILRFGVRGDTVWALQTSPSETRITLFTRAGKVLSVATASGISSPVHLGSALIMPVTMLDSGSFLGEKTFVSGGPFNLASTDTAMVPRVRFRSDGSVIDTVGWDREPPGKERRTEFAAIQNFPKHPIPVPDADEHLLNTGANGRFTVHAPVPRAEVGDSISVTRESIFGDTVYSRFYTFRAARYPEALLDSLAAESARRPGGVVRYVDGVRQAGKFTDSVAARAEIRSRMSFPGFQIPVGMTFMDTHGGLWLGRESDGGANRRWVLLDENGNLRGALDIPVAIEMVWSDGNTLWAIRQDDNDVPFLVRFLIRD